MTKAITYVGWGGRAAHVPADFNLGQGHYRDVPAYGLRRAIWDAAFGYVSGFKKRAIVYYVLTRSLNRVVCEIAMRREGVEYSGGFGSVPFVRIVSTPEGKEIVDEDLNCLSGEPCTVSKPCVECRRGD